MKEPYEKGAAICSASSLALLPRGTQRSVDRGTCPEWRGRGTKDDVYDAFFNAVDAPEWHGRNLDALADSISGGSINSEETMIRDLFDQIGGRSAVEAATKLFYDKVLQDDNLRPFFEGADMAHLQSMQAMFISMLLAGRVFTGKNLHDAHARSRDDGLNDAHFDLFLKHFRAALEEVGVKPENAEIVRQRLESKRGAVLDK